MWLVVVLEDALRGHKRIGRLGGGEPLSPLFIPSWALQPGSAPSPAARPVPPPNGLPLTATAIQLSSRRPFIATSCQ